MSSSETAPLHGVKVVELSGVGPGPFAARLLASMGADVVRIHRPGDPDPAPIPGVEAEKRWRPGLAVDIKTETGRSLVLRLVERADVLLEGFRPGVMERIGLGPEVALERNPGLVYARITGYGQSGPLADVPGHDINYIAIAGVLGAIGRRGERPIFPLNLLGDFGAGGMLVAFGILCGLHQAHKTGCGQVVDASMVEGVSQLASLFHGFVAAGSWGERGTNQLDSGAHFYEVYETADGAYMAVGAVEPQFYAELLRLLEIPADEAPQWEQRRWPELRERFAAVFASRTRDDWTEIFETADACTTPVLSLAEAPMHHHHRARGAFIDRDGATLPAPAPRFSRSQVQSGPPDGDAADMLVGWGIALEDITALCDV
jgi:alpha-methylacyl-CoA racemase